MRIWRNCLDNSNTNINLDTRRLKCISLEGDCGMKEEHHHIDFSDLLVEPDDIQEDEYIIIRWCEEGHVIEVGNIIK